MEITLKYKSTVESVEIHDISSEGKGVARVGEWVVFVDKAVPGDIVDIEVTNKKKNLVEAKIINLVKASEHRQDPYCSHFGKCGGCSWQHLKYDSQVQFKANAIEQVVRRLSKVELPAFQPILASTTTRYYRNKLDYSFSNKRWLDDSDMHIVDGKRMENPGLNLNALGFHVPGRFDKVLNVDHCYHQQDPSNDIRLKLKAFCDENSIEYFDIKKQVGQMRGLIIRNTMQGEWMVIVVFHEDNDDVMKVMNHLYAEFPTLTSLMYVINTKKNDQISDLDILTFKGLDHIIEEFDGLKYKIGPKSFFQTNSEQALKLYQKTRELANIQKHELVYDLYTGTGSIALFVAHQAKHVVGVEYVPSAIEDAWVNAKLNNIDNVSFYAGDMKDILTADFIKKNGTPDVIITDPPRAGMHADVVARINESGAKRVVYVSCNPATQARDLELMDPFYKVEIAQPVDMFPQTTHTENIITLVRR